MGFDIIELEEESNEVLVPESDIPVPGTQERISSPMPALSKGQTAKKSWKGRPFIVERVNKKN
jgi:hypothetical protein